MRALGLVLLLSGAAAIAQYAPQSAGSEPLAPELEARVHLLGKQIRCATCQGLSIADSPASMARSQLDMVRALVVEGRSDEEIKQFFVERFGEWALLKPKASSATALLWLGPVILLVGGLAFVLWFAVKHRTPAPGAKPAGSGSGSGAAAPAASGPAPGPGEEEDPYLSAVRAELDR